MSLSIVDDREVKSLGPSEDGTYTTAQGGTELMNKALFERVDKELLEKFFIIKSRVRKLDPDRPNILWLHDLWNDPEVQHLTHKQNQDKFARLVFVSNYQLATYNMGLGVPYSKSIVLKNAIDPIEYKEKSKDQIRLIYHTTPHRGLELLVPVMEKLSEMFPPNAIHLDIYSSFEAYGWKERDKPYAQLFETAKNHPNMTYHGFKPNAVIRKALQDAHIFAYPSIWVETSCIAAIEAMSAGCQVVCSNLGALPETTGNFATMYHYNEDPNHHANVFAHFLFNAIMNYWDSANQDKLAVQKNWADYSYNWESRAAEWTGLLQGLAKQYS